MQIRLVVEEEGWQVHYRFPDNQAREVERLLGSGMLVAIRSSRNFIKIRTSRFVAPYIALIKQRQLYRKKPSKAMLQWEKYQSQLIEIQRTYRLVEESAPQTFFGHWLNKVQLYLCSAIASYWEEVIKGVSGRRQEKSKSKGKPRSHIILLKINGRKILLDAISEKWTNLSDMIPWKNSDN